MMPYLTHTPTLSGIRMRTMNQNKSQNDPMDATKLRSLSLLERNESPRLPKMKRMWGRTVKRFVSNVEKPLRRICKSGVRLLSEMEEAARTDP